MSKSYFSSIALVMIVLGISSIASAENGPSNNSADSSVISRSHDVTALEYNTWAEKKSDDSWAEAIKNYYNVWVQADHVTHYKKDLRYSNDAEKSDAQSMVKAYCAEKEAALRQTGKYIEGSFQCKQNKVFVSHVPLYVTTIDSANPQEANAVNLAYCAVTFLLCHTSGNYDINEIQITMLWKEKRDEVKAEPQATVQPDNQPTLQSTSESEEAPSSTSAH